ncbi:Myosin-15, partial [Mucuna pruriens]
MKLFCDNNSTISTAYKIPSNMTTQNTEIGSHFIIKKLDNELIVLAHVSIRFQMANGLRSPLKLIGYDDSTAHVEARYPAILFKQQLTACVERIFGLIRDNLKKELSPLLGS